MPNGPYTYPLAMEDRLPTRITFQAMEVDPPEFTAGDRAGYVNGNSFTDLFSTSEATRIRTADKLVNSAGDVGIKGLEVSERTGEKVSLYLNLPFQVNDEFSYNTNALNISGAAALNELEAGGGAISAAAKGVIEGFSNITSLFGSGSASIGARIAISRLANSPAGFLVPEGIRNAIGLAARVTINPNLRTTFDGVQIRQFEFAFKFLPKSGDEAREVKNIIRFFRFYAYPREILLGKAVPIGFDYPDMFKIKLQSNLGGTFKNIGTPIKLSYIRSVRSIYNPTQQTFHADGEPVEIDLQLAFVEYKTLAKQDVMAEGTEDFYDINTKKSEKDYFDEGDISGPDPVRGELR